MSLVLGDAELRAGSKFNIRIKRFFLCLKIQKNTLNPIFLPLFL